MGLDAAPAAHWCVLNVLIGQCVLMGGATVSKAAADWYVSTAHQNVVVSAAVSDAAERDQV